jgi:MFS family permease
VDATVDVTADSATTARSADERRGSVRALLRSPAFTGVLIANILAAIALGTSRFVFVWLIGELTEWNPATAILGIVIGVPPLMLSAWAGSLADRIEPRKLGVTLFGISMVLFTATAVLVESDVMTVPLAMVCAFVTATAPAMLVPLLQALVPQIVPQRQLMQAVALQNLGMMTSIIAGVFFGGAIIQAFGVSAGFWLLVVATALGIVVYHRTPLPDRPVTVANAIRHAAGIALRTEPLRSLLALTGVLGLVIAASTLLLPELARDVLGTGSLAASALNVCMSLGMVTTSMVLATRWTPSRPGLVLAIATSAALGTGLVAIGSSRVYALTALFCLLWGLSGGIAMTLMRTLLQLHTPPELMGRVMGLSAMAQNGAFPIGALALFGLVTVTSVSTAMILAGVICSVLVWLIVLRPTIRSL